MKKILLVDDHPVLLEGLTLVIERQEDLEVCGTAASAEEAREAIARLRPDVAVVDLSLKDSSGLEFTREVGRRWPALPVLMLSMHDEGVYAERCLRAGARGYIMKQESVQRIMEAIRRVLAGDVFLSPRMTSAVLKRYAEGKVVPAAAGLASLSDRELQVFEMIGAGRTTREIAAALELSTRTVETHRENIKAKLDLHHASELVQRAALWVETGKKP